MSLVSKLRSRAVRAAYGPVEGAFRALENRYLSRGAILKPIPPHKVRADGGLGTLTYGEWCYTIGLFQGLIFQNLPKRPIRMLDVGCGVGRLYLAAKTFLTDEDRFTGLDVVKRHIDFNARHYGGPNVCFTHTEASNAFYAGHVQGGPKAWPMKDGAFNLVTALSVWTHLGEADWRFYLNEVGRVLAPGGRAIISFFILDELYRPEAKTSNISAFYPQPENKWIFDARAYESEHWRYPSWAEHPEHAIALPKAVFDQAAEEAGLRVLDYRPGQWKDQPGFFFQDVVVFEKV